MSNTTVRISPGQLTDSLALRRDSALSYCTAIDSDDAGVFFSRNYPTLSSGEDLLWQVLAWLNGQGDLPDKVELLDGLDEQNYGAAMAAVAVGVGL